MVFDAVVIGIGHAGIEAAVALAKKGYKTLALSISLDNAGFLACNPSIGGTAKGHLVCEVDALGGQMGVGADLNTTHIRMLNSSKGASVQSLRAQIDKYKYHDYMKSLLENTSNLTLRQGEAVEILTKDGKVIGVKTRVGLEYKAKAVVVACGVYLESAIIIGDIIEENGPCGFNRSNHIANSLRNLGFTLRRFKTGTPARIKRGSVDFSVLEVQESEEVPYTFSQQTGTGSLFEEQQLQSQNLQTSLKKVPVPVCCEKENYELRITNEELRCNNEKNKLIAEKASQNKYDNNSSFIIHHSSLKKDHCYLGYTNPDTHQLIKQNLKKSPKYAGLIKGAGARYCPSVEDKVVRFENKERHSFFLESEGAKTAEMYVQGLSTGLPAEVQLQVYQSIKGLENVEIMRDAYAIEYECIDPTELYASLESKQIKGLFFAGQINGTSGYEEAAAQGLIAGINASQYLAKKPPVILPREISYIGVLIDDLVTKGTDEPYRMMTSRAEFRLLLRQDNADLRLTETGYKAGLVSEEQYVRLKTKKADIESAKKILQQRVPMNEVNFFLEKIGEPKAHSALSVEEIIKRNAVNQQNFTAYFDFFNSLSSAAVYDIFIETKYAGYIVREKQAVEEALRLSELKIPADTDYNKINGLRLEAKEKLAHIKPLTIGQASRISGINPADINVLIITLTNKKQKR